MRVNRMLRSATLDLEQALDGADLVLVHEWSEHALVKRIGEHRKHHRYQLLFHDTHHRCVTEPGSMAAYDLQHYDGVLAFGSVIRDHYRKVGWARRAWTCPVEVCSTRPRVSGSGNQRSAWWDGWGTIIRVSG